MRCFGVIMLGLIALALLPGPALGDVLIRQIVHTDLPSAMGETQTAQDDTSTIWLSTDRLAVSGGGADALVRLDLSQFYLINHEDQSYVMLSLPIDLANVLPEDDPSAQMFKQMMQAMQTTITVTPTDQTKEIRSWDARLYQVEMKNNFVTIQMDAWATEDTSVDPKLYWKLYEALFSVNPVTKDAMSSFQKIKGIIVLQEQTVQVMGQETKQRTEVIEIREEKAPREVFRLPKGYEKKTFNPMEAMGR
ncbi:MAG: hypothetical protein KAY32_06745 [Candidatus Eisenbacteria sp.]|nr:hypothetical protein [Candidatus Eisenbacteria bacterium]